MKSVELFIALSLATTIGISSDGTVNASEHELTIEKANNTSTYLISEGGESGEGGEGGEGA